MMNRVLAVVGVSALALAACASEVQPSPAQPQGMAVPAAPTAGLPPVAAPVATPAPAMPAPAMPAAPAAAPTPAAPAAPAPAATPTPAAPAPVPPAMVISANETWTDGKQISTDIVIAPGATVTIAPGAKIAVTDYIEIIVKGSLIVDAKANHAKIAGPSWDSITADAGGTLKLVGLDVSGADAIATEPGALVAEYSYGTVTMGRFSVAAGTTMKVDHAAIVMGGGSMIAGTFTGTFLDYSGSSMMMSDEGASLFVADSKITGELNDFFLAGGGKLMHVEYTTVDNTHCPFHINSIQKFEIDHVTTGGPGTAGVESTSGFGQMIFNVEPGPHTISNSNFNDPDFAQSEPTVVIQVSNTFIANTTSQLGMVTYTPADAQGNNAQRTQIPDAKPRGTPGPG